MAPLVTQATWSADNVYLDAEHGEFTAFSFPGEGDKIVPRRLFASKQLIYRAPRFLAGRKQFLFATDGADAAIWTASLDGAAPHRISTIAPDTDSAAESWKNSWLVHVRRNVLVAHRFDPGRAELSGEPVTIANDVSVDPDNMAGAFSVSASGAIAWRAGPSVRRQLMWFDRSGRQLGAFGAPDPLVFDPEISPDGQRVALTRGRIDFSNIWIQEGSRSSRFTANGGDDRITIWSPDGKEIVYASKRGVQFDLYRKPSDGVGPETLLLKSDVLKFPCSWSPDGRFIIYWAQEHGGELMVLPLFGDRKPFPFLNTPFGGQGAVFSPDGKWVAYESNESGRFEVYVRAFPGPGPARPVSTAGGGSARWRRDGKELYFLAPDSTLMAASVTVHGSAFEAGTPQALFRTHAVYFPGAPQYDVSRDGRFLIVTELESAGEPIHVLLNWKPPAK